MARVTIGFAVGFIVLGVGAYVVTAFASPTALIPAAFGLVLLVLGLLALKENLRKVMMHIAVAWGVLGFLGTVGGIGGVARMLAGQEVERPAAAVVQSLTAVLAAVFVGLCVKSFIDARRRQRAAGEEPRP